jgi:mersacidin/lichenicidin family type 2 lantibiotic
MSTLTIIRAWKDPGYRCSLTQEQQTRLPAHPAGAIEFQVQALQELLGGSHFSPCHKCTSTGP